jgi:Rrf2 family iron-sulfur cluster assembly transcriptional regulator
MRLTRAGEYAVRCVLYLAAQQEGEVVRRQEIAQQMEIPNQFLGKIVQQLARSGIVEIVQGSKGGYRLLVPPQRLSLLDVVEGVTGEIFLNDCILRPDSCLRSHGCSVHRVWERARNQLRDTLRKARFDKLLREDSCVRAPSKIESMKK